MNIWEQFLAALAGEPVDGVPLLMDGFLYNEVGYLLNRQHRYMWQHRPRKSVRDGYIFNDHQEIEQEADPLKRELCYRVVELCRIVPTWPSYENQYLMTPPRYIEESVVPLGPGLVRTTATIRTPNGNIETVASQTHTRFGPRSIR